MPVPLITRLISPKLPPPIVPLKVVEPPVGLQVRVDGKPVLLLMTLPPRPGVRPTARRPAGWVRRGPATRRPPQSAPCWWAEYY